MFRFFKEAIPIAYVTPTMALSMNTAEKHDKSLKVFILNDQDEKWKNESLKLFVELYSMRLRTDREFWLFDATALINDKRGEVSEMVEDLKELKLDLDDDLFVINHNSYGNALKLYELYEIHPTLPKQVLFYGLWDSSIGLLLNETKKWDRRKNLQVIDFLTKSESIFKVENLFSRVCHSKY